MRTMSSAGRPARASSALTKPKSKAALWATIAASPRKASRSSMQLAKSGLSDRNWIDRPCTASARSEEHTSELQSLMRISYAVFCLKKKKQKTNHNQTNSTQTHHKSHKSKTQIINHNKTI